LPPLVQWVEQGIAPDFIVATGRSGTTSTSRILCPWPLQPTYIGPRGSNAENTPANWVASNFECRAPQ
jgi:hypothetical protein